MKKLGSLLIVLALSGLFLGCQKSAPTGESAAPAATSESTSAPSGEAQPAGEESAPPAESTGTGGEAQQ